MALPAVHATVTHHAGTALVRPTTRAIDPAPADALAVRVMWTALQRMPDGLSSVAPNARLIEVPSSTQPIRTSGQLLGAVGLVERGMVDRFLEDVQAHKYGQSAEITALRGALPADVTAVFGLTESSGDVSRGRIELTVYRAATTAQPDQIQLGLLLSDPPHRERALLDPVPVTSNLTLAVVLPVHFGATESRAMLAVIDISHQVDAEHRQAVAQCVRDLASPPVASTQPAAPPAEWPALAAALRTLSDQPQAVRAALSFMSSQTGAALCGDVALVADDAVLASLSGRMTSKIGTTPEPLGRARVGWLLDLACFEELAALQSAGTMPPELSAVLTAYAGEAGRHAASLDEVARASQSREHLEARLLAENLVYLEDASPAARVRAFDWLTTKEHAPAGYDPLAPNRQRRAALDKALSAAAANPSGGAK